MLSEMKIGDNSGLFWGLSVKSANGSIQKKKSLNHIFDKPEQMFASSVANFAKVSNLLGLT